LVLINFVFSLLLIKNKNFMKNIYKMMLAVALFCAATWQVAAQTVIVPPTDGSYFYIQFTRGKNLVLESQGSGTLDQFGFVLAGTNQLKAATLDFGKQTQLWRAEVNGSGYTFISKALDIDGTTNLQIAWDAVAGRFIATPYSNASNPLYTTTTGITTTAAYLPACAIAITPDAAQGGMNPVGGSAPGNVMGLFNLTDDGNALRFVASNSFLLDAINRVTAASLNQGSRSAAVQAALQAAIDAAKVVYNNPASTDANYSASIDALNAALIVYDAVLGPPTDGSYFYIQFTRGTNLVLENKGNGNQLQTAELVFGKESQLWRADSDPSHPGAAVFVSKAFDNSILGEVKISWDATAARFVAAPNDGAGGMYTTTRGITTTAAYLPASVIMISANAAMAMNPVGGSNIGKTLGLWNVTDDGNALRFVPVDSKVFLNAYLTQANGMLASASLNPGNHSAEVLATLKAIVVSSQAVSDDVNSTVDAVIAAGNALKDGIAAYNAAPYTILPAISSVDASNEKWYFFQGTRPANTYLTSTGAGANLFSKAVIPDDTQLWKIVPNTNPLGTTNGYALVNKKTGEYLNTDIGNNLVLNTTPNMPMLNVVFNISTIMTNGVARFWVENAGTTSADATLCTFRLHAGDGVFNAKNWYGNRTDNSSWLLMDYSISLKGFLKDAITAANVMVNDPNVPVTTAIGQYLYPAGAQTTLAAAVAVAQAVYDNASATDVDVIAAKVKLDAAVIFCKGTRSQFITSTAANPRWFVIRNLNRADAAGVKNQVISTNGVVENGGLIYESQANANDQLWRFEINPTGGAKIISAAQPTLGIQRTVYNTPQNLAAVASASGYSIDILGTGYRLTDSIGNSLHGYNGKLITWNDGAGTATNWAIEERTLPLFLPQTLTFDPIPAKLTTDVFFNLAATTDLPGGIITYTSSNVSVGLVEGNKVTIFGSGITTITASNPGDATYARASVKQVLTVNLPNGVHNVADGISIEVKNGLIIVTGTDAPANVFTVTGIEVNAKRVLTPGIYIVKVAGKTVKVNVR
jgi:hypothetical protein